MFGRFSDAPGKPDVFSLLRFYSHRPEEFLSPFLLRLDDLLDRRLVSTFLGLCQGIIRHRSRSMALLLSELGGVMLSGGRAPAGTKRISNLLRSKKWQASAVLGYLARQAAGYVEGLLEKRQLVLLPRDESVQEKAESLQS